jgi:hypothetical protein
MVAALLKSQASESSELPTTIDQEAPTSRSLHRLPTIDCIDGLFFFFFFSRVHQTNLQLRQASTAAAATIPVRPSGDRSSNVLFDRASVIVTSSAASRSWAVIAISSEHVKLARSVSILRGHRRASTDHDSGSGCDDRAAGLRLSTTALTTTYGATSISILGKVVTGPVRTRSVLRLLLDVGVGRQQRTGSASPRTKLRPQHTSDEHIDDRQRKQAIFAITAYYTDSACPASSSVNGVISIGKGTAKVGHTLSRRTCPVRETTTNCPRALGRGAWNTLSFGPGLLKTDRHVSWTGSRKVQIDTNIGQPHRSKAIQPYLFRNDRTNHLCRRCGRPQHGLQPWWSHDEFAQIF